MLTGPSGAHVRRHADPFKSGQSPPVARTCQRVVCDVQQGQAGGVRQASRDAARQLILHSSKQSK